MLNKLSKFIQKHFKLVLIISGIFTLLSIFWISKLNLNMRMQDMLPQDQPHVVAYQNALDNFVGIDMVPIIIEGDEKNIQAYIEHVSKELKQAEYVDAVIYQGEQKFLKKQGLLLIKQKDINAIKGMLLASSIKDFVKGLNNNFEKEYIEDQDTKKISKDRREMLAIFNTIEDFLNMLSSKNLDKENIKTLAEEFLIGPKYILSSDRKMGLMFIKTPISMTDIDLLIPFINNIESIVKANQKQFDISAGLTGFLVLQRDEMKFTQRDMRRSFILSLVLITIIFLIGFRLFRYTILAVIPLVVGIIWAMGLTYVTIGALNAFTAMMGAILIGLGIDYAIHIIAIYTEERSKGMCVADSIDQVFKKSVKGIITGSVTTAIGFGMFTFSSFPAFQEFGITLGLGILCTLCASIFILPSLLMVFGKPEIKKIVKFSAITKFYQYTVINRPLIPIIILAVLVVFALVRINDVSFTKNIKDIEPKGLESLELNDKLIEKFDFTNDVTIGVTKTIEEARKLKDAAEELNTVGMVDTIADYIPPAHEMKARLNNLAQIKKQMPNISSNLYMQELKDELYRLEDNLIELSDLSYMGGEQKIVKRIDKLIESNLLLDTITAVEDNKQNLSFIQNNFIEHIHNIVLSANSSKPIGLDDLPQNIKDRYIGKDGSYLTNIYPKADVWTNDFQPLFIREIKSLGKALTGASLLSIETMSIAAKEGKKILIFVIIAIFIVLWIDFGSLKFALLGLSPMFFTLLLALGIMAWFDIKFDYVNIIALPIIIGIGVDDGIHFIHRYRLEQNLLTTMKSTGRGILLTSFTTIAAFGTMIFSQYQGFASFGKLLIMGIALSYILTIFLVGSLIRISETNKN